MTRRSGIRPWLGLGRDRRAVAVLEFAILGPILFVMIFAMIDAVWMVTSGAAAVHATPKVSGVARTASGGTPLPLSVRHRG